MRQRLGWPKIIGGILALESAGLILWQHEWWFYHADVAIRNVLSIEWFWLVVTVLLSFLSVGVYCAREWARRAVVVLGSIALLVLIVATVWQAFDRIGRIPDLANEVTPATR